MAYFTFTICKSFTHTAFSFLLVTNIIASYLGFIFIACFAPKHTVVFTILSISTTFIIGLHSYLIPVFAQLAEVLRQAAQKLYKTKVRGYYSPTKDDFYWVIDDSPHKLPSSQKTSGWGQAPETPWEFEQD